MPAAAAVAKPARIDMERVFKEIREDAKYLNDVREEVEHRLPRLANNCFKVQSQQLYLTRVDPETKKTFTTFRRWCEVEIGLSYTTIYRFIGIRKHLKSIPDKTIEKIGKTRCDELCKVAQEKPSLLPRFVKALEKEPDMPLYTLKQRVTNTLAGSEWDSGDWTRFEFAVKAEDAPYVVKAIAVLQAVEAVKNPETPAGRGFHLISLCQEYLSGKDASTILKRLEEAGAFNGNGVFKLEE